MAVLGEAERALQAAAGGWNLRQFDLAPRHRGATRAARRLAALPGAGLAPGARAAWWRWPLVQLVGLNAWAWHAAAARSTSSAQAMVELLQSTHPQVRAVLDAPLQMARETERLRAAAGQPGDDDLETLLAAAAAAWPEGEPPVAEPAVRARPAGAGRRRTGTMPASRALRELAEPAGWAVAPARAPARDRASRRARAA